MDILNEINAILKDRMLSFLSTKKDDKFRLGCIYCHQKL